MKLYGTVCYTSEGKLKLEALGDWEECLYQGKSSLIPIIHGLTTNGKKVSLISSLRESNPRDFSSPVACYRYYIQCVLENIHSAQMREMLYVPFYLCYLLEWLLRLPLPGNAYRNISFEREAYKHQSDLDYLNRRGRFAWYRYLLGGN